MRSKLSEKLKNGINISVGQAVLELLIETAKILFWSISQKNKTKQNKNKNKKKNKQTNKNKNKNKNKQKTKNAWPTRILTPSCFCFLNHLL